MRKRRHNEYNEEVQEYALEKDMYMESTRKVKKKERKIQNRYIENPWAEIKGGTQKKREKNEGET